MKPYNSLLDIILDPKNRVFVLVGSLFLVLFIANLFSKPSSEPTPQKSINPVVETVPELSQEEKDSIYTASVYERYAEIEKVINADKGIKKFGSKEEIDFRLLLLREYTTKSSSIDFENYKDLDQKAKKLQAKVKNLKNQEFPLMRRDFGKIFDEMMWEYDIDVVIKGNRNTTIEVIGGLFAANKNIKFVHEKMRDRFVELKFKRAQYKWYEGDDEYTYYTLEPSPDTN